MILLMLLCTWCVPAMAMNWVLLNTTNGISLYIDSDAIERNGDTATVMTKLTYDGYTQYDRIRFHRNERTYAFMNEVVYAPSGSRVKDQSTSQLVYNPIRRDDGFDIIYRVLWGY